MEPQTTSTCCHEAKEHLLYAHVIIAVAARFRLISSMPSLMNHRGHNLHTVDVNNTTWYVHREGFSQHQPRQQLLSMLMPFPLMGCSEGITRARPHFAMSSSSSTSTNRNRGWIHVCTWRISRGVPPRRQGSHTCHVLVRYWCFWCIARYATKYQVTYENRRLPTYYR